ncbi:MAG: CFI-box-CTERM domain-containing protein [Myxococcota bacterium]
MVKTEHKRIVFAGLLGMFCLVGQPALADIDGFEILEISPVGDVSLNSRLGTTSSATEHLINIADCESYADGTVQIEIGVDTSNYVSFSYGVAVALPGSTCNADSTDFAGSDDTVCKVLESAGELDTSFKVTVDLDRLTGGDCTSGTEASSVLYVVVADSDAANSAKQEVLFNVDLLRPAAPTITEVIGGDGRLEVLFDDSDNETEEGLSYDIYWSTTSIPETPGSDVSSGSTSSTTYEIDDESIVNGLTYYVRVGATDSADNDSALSDELSVVPVPTTDFWEAYKAAGGTDPGGFCFIATAAYGSPMGADLDLLRAFRDQILWPTALGRSFVRSYYSWGRHAAAWIAARPVAKAVVRVALQPLVWVAALTTTIGALGTLLLFGLVLSAVMLLWRHRRERAVHALEVS